MKYAVLYACVTDEDEDGLLVDCTYFGGITSTQEEADALARDITEDNTIKAVVIPKTYPMNDHMTIGRIWKQAHKHFNQMAIDMYDMEDRRQTQKTRPRAELQPTLQEILHWYHTK